jgi:beta-xylosidase
MRRLIAIITLLSSFGSHAQILSWLDSIYGVKNPMIHADYSDPDAIRVGNDFYLVASSFNAAPGLPILHSQDLLNWELSGYALQRLVPREHFEQVQHGGGVWAPSIRYHNNEFYIYYPDPDFGIYLVKAKNIKGPWSAPVLVQEGQGLIDPCPLWDDNGKVYLVHAFAGSRAGIKSILVVKQLSADGTKVLDDGVLVYDGHGLDPTIEGPKFYKRNGYYYIFAPAGGVSTGWQLALRSKNIYGPYERKVVLNQGITDINGPHQGAWVTTVSGEDWFIHFQDKEAYGRILHLQPMKWVDDWPYIGHDYGNDGIGEPVHFHKIPKVAKTGFHPSIPDSDEFNSPALGLQWQWQANPNLNWAIPFVSNGTLRLNSYYLPPDAPNLYNDPALLLQKFPAENFLATTKLSFTGNNESEKAGLIIFGNDYAYIAVEKKKNGLEIEYRLCRDADKGNNEETVFSSRLKDTNTVYFQVNVVTGGQCIFSYSTDGKKFDPIATTFLATPGKWVGAKLGLFCTRAVNTNDGGYADIDWFRIEKRDSRSRD